MLSETSHCYVVKGKCSLENMEHNVFVVFQGVCDVRFLIKY